MSEYKKELNNLKSELENRMKRFSRQFKRMKRGSVFLLIALLTNILANKVMIIKGLVFEQFPIIMKVISVIAFGYLVLYMISIKMMDFYINTFQKEETNLHLSEIARKLNE